MSASTILTLITAGSPSSSNHHCFHFLCTHLHFLLLSYLIDSVRDSLEFFFTLDQQHSDISKPMVVYVASSDDDALELSHCSNDDLCVPSRKRLDKSMQLWRTPLLISILSDIPLYSRIASSCAQYRFTSNQFQIFVCSDFPRTSFHGSPDFNHLNKCGQKVNIS